MSHLALLLYAGDYYDATVRRAEGHPDRYRHHSYALDSLGRLRADGCEVTVVQMHSEEEYDRLGGDGTRFLGLGRGSAARAAERIGAFLHAGEVTHTMVRFPSREVLEVILSSSSRGSAVLADSFPSRLRNRARYRELGRLLGDPGFDFVANHHLRSSRQLVDVLGLDASRVIPWDWPLDLTGRASTSARQHPGPGPLRLCYVGTIGRIKGVWDVLEAVRLLRERGEDVRLEVAGAGDLEGLWRLVDRADLRERVTYLGRVGGDEILEVMSRASFVCVPSRHAYPEGLPLTLYEAMASGTPVVASDHPMFGSVVHADETAFVFRAGRAKDLASVVHRAWRDPDLWERVSATAAEAYPSMGLTTLWGDLLHRWVRGRAEDIAWLRAVSLDPQ